MTSFYSICEFHTVIKNLCKEKEYKSVMTDIADVFEGRSIKEIRDNREMIFSNDNLAIVKLRIQNSGRSLSKSKGWRLIYYVSRKCEEVIFLYIYPKRGKHACQNISKKKIDNLIEILIEEKENNLLKVFNPDDCMSEVISVISSDNLGDKKKVI